ncbi:MAG: glycosyltransferase family 2 protein [Alphaproteobacteria bacterium]|nr:glycosyltransferase family 2 protein [Alphaproteobacteria bacterium]
MAESHSISICVCTYNRADFLRDCLQSILQLENLRSETVELIVVDNNSTDETEALVKEIANVSPIAVRYIFEATQGLSVARNRGADESSGRYIAYVDDDCVLATDWLRVAFTIIKVADPVIAGGPYFGRFTNEPRPSWFKLEYGNAYFVGQYEEAGYYSNFRASGGNMLIRRDVFDLVRFSTRFGVSGNKLILGEERHLQDQYLARTGREGVFYSPDLRVEHTIHLQKMSLAYCARRNFAIGRTHAVMGIFSKVNVRLLAFFPALLAFVAMSPILSLVRPRAQYPNWRNFYYETVLPYPARGFGLAVGLAERFGR